MWLDRCKVAVLILLITVFAVCSAGWHTLPIKSTMDTTRIISFTLGISQHPLAPFITILLYAAGGLCFFPIVMLIPLTAFIFGPVQGAFYSLAGIMANASLLYALGHLLGYSTVRRLIGTRAHRWNQQLLTHDILAVVTIRVLPLAPFSVVNLIAGASPIPFWKYILGTLIGIIPAVTIMTFLGNRIQIALNAPLLKNILIVSVTLILSGLTFLLARRRNKENLIT